MLRDFMLESELSTACSCGHGGLKPGFLLQMSALKLANKELKGITKKMNISDIDVPYPNPWQLADPPELLLWLFVVFFEPKIGFLFTEHAG